MTFAVIVLRWMSLSVDFQITPPLCELRLRSSWGITGCVVLVAVAPLRGGTLFSIPGCGCLWLLVDVWFFLWTRGA